MDRRDFLHASVIATLASQVLGQRSPAHAQPRSSAVAKEPGPPRRLILDAYTRNLQWLRDPDRIAEAAVTMTCTGVNPTIQEHPGHINPANVARELPAFVKVMQKHGLRVKQVRGGNQTDVAADHVEAIVATMAQVGATHYWLGTDNYDLAKPILPQLDAIKRKVEAFVRLNEKHGTTLMYHTRAGSRAVGAVVWDLLYVLREFDPKYVGLHWDTGHMSHHGSDMWELLMRTAGPYVVAIGWKDRSWEQVDGKWRSPYVPMGTGLVDAARYVTVLHDIGFDGPMELQAEYPNGGSEAGADKITLPPAQVLGALRKDVETIRAAFAQSKSGLAI